MSTSSYDSKHKFPFQIDTGVSDEDVCRATVADSDSCERLIDDYTRNLFGNVDCKKLIDTCFLPVCLRNQDELVAFICLHDRPNIPSIPSSDWTSWARNLYNLKASIPYNTLWIHLAGWDNRYTYTFLSPILRHTFLTCTSVEHILLVIPPNTTYTSWLDGKGTRLIPAGFYDANKVQTLYLILRQHFVTKYKIRRAVEEDNDDLTPLIYANSARLQNIYGEFYIAEMITRHQNSGRQLIVAEYNDNAVAVLCLNEVLNEPLLNEEFELAPFYGLRKSHLDDNVYDLIRPSSITGLLSDGAERELTSLVNILQLEEAEASYGSSVEQEANHSDVDYFINVPSVDLSTKAASDVTHSSKTSNAFSGMMLSSNDYQAHLFAERKAEVDLEEECTPPEFPPFTRIPTPVYHGDINAFTLELAVSHPDHESETIPLLLQAAFECFPERDYCILSIPSTCPPFPLLNLFVRVAPRATSTYPHELYLLHRNSVLSTLETRQAAVPDIEEVQEFIENIPVAHTFIDNFLAAICEEDDFESYLLTSENKIVGVAVIRQENENEYLNNHYNVNEWINEEYHKDDGRALLIHLVLSPIFQRQSQFFLREILRLSDYTVLFYRISSADLSSATRDRPLCGILDYLFPLRPRHLPEFPNIRSYQEFKVIEKIAPFTVYLTTINLCTLRYIEINTKIVVIGSSDTALAFLMGLIHSPRTLYKANFSNVTVVSPHGLSYDKPNKILSRFFVQRSTFNYQHIQMDTLKTYVNEVNGVLTKIDRKNKCIVINEDSTLSYDLLFIMCGKQFQKPIMSGNKKHPISRFPENVFLINTQMDANNALGQLKRLSMRKCKSDKIIVYGYAMEVYCCITALIKYGISPDNIQFVESFPFRSPGKIAEQLEQFNDPVVGDTVRTSIVQEGVRYYSSYYFVDWIIHKDENIVTTVKFESQQRRVNLSCKAMFMYNDKLVSGRTFSAISSAGLVFDGALVIAPDCKTNDPFIYAAGTVTKYSRRYYADDLAHQFFNSEEIGTKLGQSIRAKLIPNCDEKKYEDILLSAKNSSTVPLYEKPLITFCRLPRKLRYLSVTNPGKQIPWEIGMASDNYGEILVSGNCVDLERQGYFRLHLNNQGIVETITCLAKFNIDIANITRLWGKHERLLNNLKMRFGMGTVQDLYEYFREPWASAIYHDFYPSLEHRLHHILTQLTSSSGEFPVDNFLKIYENNDRNERNESENEEGKLLSFICRTLTEEILQFVKDNRSFLPMYAYPSYIRNWLISFERSPLFHAQ